MKRDAKNMYKLIGTFFKNLQKNDEMFSVAFVVFFFNFKFKYFDECFLTENNKVYVIFAFLRDFPNTYFTLEMHKI